jgi:apolipoprotein D and lipocalin family protein
MHASPFLPFVLALFALLGCADRDPPVATNLDLVRFQGRWYEIARIPRNYDELCYDTTADYELAGPGALDFWHQCRLGSPLGRLSEFYAPARAEDPNVPAKLTLDLGLYRGAYWVLDVGRDYEYALIGHPSLTMLWVLSRTPKLDGEKYARALDLARRDGFSTDELVLTPQSLARD